MSNCIVCGDYVPEGRLICTICEKHTASPNKKAQAIEVLNRINSEGRLDYQDYLDLYRAISSIS